MNSSKWTIKSPSESSTNKKHWS